MKNLSLWTMLYFHLVLKFSWVTAIAAANDWRRNPVPAPELQLKYKEWLGGKESFLTTYGLYVWRQSHEDIIRSWHSALIFFLIVIRDSHSILVCIGF